MTYKVELNDDPVDDIVVQVLADCRSTFISQLGSTNYVFFFKDPEENDKEIQKHIDALDVVIQWFATPDALEKIYGGDTGDHSG